MDLVVPDHEPRGARAVHRHRVVAGAEDLAVLDRDVVPAHEPHADAPALEAEAVEHEVIAVHELDVVLRVHVVGRPREQRALSGSRADHDGRLGGSIHGDRAPCGLRVGASAQRERVARLERVRDALEFLIRARDGGLDLDRARRRGSGSEREREKPDSRAKNIGIRRTRRRRGGRRAGEPETTLLPPEESCTARSNGGRDPRRIARTVPPLRGGAGAIGRRELRPDTRPKNPETRSARRGGRTGPFQIAWILNGDAREACGRPNFCR